MKRQTRYFFIFSGLIIFLILTPLIVLYVGGVAYDSTGNRYVKTGLLVAKSDPSGARVLLDGKDSGTTPANLRFLRPGGYEVRINKDGYYPWIKRLDVEAGKVTYAAVDFPDIYLFKKAPTPVIVAEGVIDFHLGKNNIFYLTQSDLVTIGISETDGTTNLTAKPLSLPLPRPADHIYAGSDTDYFLLTGPGSAMIYDASAQKILDITDLTKGLEKLILASDNKVYGLVDNQIVQLDWQRDTRAVVQTDCLAFATTDDTLYLIQKEAAQMTLMSAPLSQPVRTQNLLDNLPNLAEPGILVTRQKDIFLTGNQNLYKVGSGLDLLVSNISDLQFDPALPALSFTSNNQAEFYNFTVSRIQLITRSTEIVRQPLVRVIIGYAFLAQNNRIYAWELDNRDRQNNYLLMEAPAGPSNTPTDQKVELALDKNNKTLYTLQSGTLRFAQIH